MTAADLAKGAIFEARFRIEGLLGEGGYGAVYEATQLGVTERPVAIKVLHPGSEQTDARRQRFEDEARATCRVTHPHALTVHEFGVTADGRMFLVSERLFGESLRSLLDREGSLSVTRAVRIAVQALKALGEYHDRDIVHRDLKPENLFMCDVRGEADFVKVIDFGIAWMHRDGKPRLTGDNRAIGTPLYMSPEQIRAEPVGPACDLYAIGLLLYELIAGRPPFLATSPIDVIMAHLSASPPPLNAAAAGVPPALNALVQRCMAKAQNERPASADELRDELEGALFTPGLLESPGRSESVTLEARIDVATAGAATITRPAGSAGGRAVFTAIVAARVDVGEHNRDAPLDEQRALVEATTELLSRVAAPFDVTPAPPGRRGELAWVVGRSKRRRDDTGYATRLAGALCGALSGWRAPGLRHLDAPSVRVAVDAGDLLVHGASVGGREAGDTWDPTDGLLGDACLAAGSAPAGRVLITRAAHDAMDSPPGGEPAGRGVVVEAASLADPHQLSLDVACEAPFVGREDELALLSRRWARVRADERSELCWIEGDPGIGKTRLALELARHARTDGRVVTTVCSDRTSVVFSAGTALLHHLRGDTDLADHLVALLGDVAGEATRASLTTLVHPAPVPLTDLATLAGRAPVSREAALDALVQVVRAETATRPLLWIVDGAERLDSASAELVRRCGDLPCPLLVVGTMGGTDADWREPLLRAGSRLTPNPLRTPDVRRYLEQHPDASVAALAARSEELTNLAGGNPLVLEEAARRMARDPEVSSGAAGRLRAWIEERLDGLVPGERAVLEACAVPEPPFPLDALAHVAGLSVDDTFAAIQSLARTGWLRVTHLACDDPDRCHHLELALPLTGELLLRRVMSAQRATLHRRWLERIRAEPERFHRPPAVIAEHEWHGGRPARALPGFLEAAAHACQVSSPDDARPLLARAEACADRLDTPAARLSVARGAAYADYLDGAYNDCISRVDETLATDGPEAGPVERTGLASIAALAECRRGSPAEALARVDAALSELEHAGDVGCSLTASLLQIRAWALFVRTGPGDAQAAVRALQRATRMVDTSTPSAEVGIIHRLLANLYSRLSDLTRSGQHHARSLQIFTALGRPRDIAVSQLNRGTIRALTGDVTGAEEDYRAARRVYEALADDGYLAMCDHNLGDLALQCGDAGGAIEALDRALTRLRPSDTRWFLPETLHTLALARLLGGDRDGCRTANAEALSVAEELGLGLMTARCRALRAAWADVPDPTGDRSVIDPETALKRAVAELHALGQPGFAAAGRVAFYCASGRPDRAAEALSDLPDDAPAALRMTAEHLVGAMA